MGMVINTAARFGVSPFERAIQQLNPIFHARFRDSDFSTQIDDSSGNGRHLVKQIAAATRSAVPTRTTHPGGALFPAVTMDDFATLGTTYKTAGNITELNATAELTVVVSARVIQPVVSTDQYLMTVGTENAGVSASNQLVSLRNITTSLKAGYQQRDDLSGNFSAETDVTGIVSDGVNRLYFMRYEDGVLRDLITTKPGHAELVEEQLGDIGSSTGAFNRPLIVNTRVSAATGVAESAAFVIDNISIFDTNIGASAQTDLSTKWLAELGGYHPSMMLFDGSTGFYSKTYTSSGNLVVGVLRFNRASFTGDTVEGLMRLDGPTGDQRIAVFAFSSDHSTAPNRADHIQVQTRNSAGAVICQLVADGYLDGADHVLFYAFDGDNGTAIFRIDGVDADDTGNADRVAPTTGSLDAGATSAAVVGSGTAGGSLFFGGKIGFVGHAEAYLTNFDDFMDGNLPKAIDEKDWTEFGGTQPEVFSHTGKLDGLGNKGSIGAFTKNGTITMTEGGSP